MIIVYLEAHGATVKVYQGCSPRRRTEWRRYYSANMGHRPTGGREKRRTSLSPVVLGDRLNVKLKDKLVGSILSDVVDFPTRFVFAI